MKMEGAGLIDFWTKQWSADPSYCLKKNDQLLMNNNKIAARKEDKKRLTLKGLSGSFVIFAAGSTLAIAAFILEICCHKRLFRRNKIRDQKKVDNKTKMVVMVNKGRNIHVVKPRRSAPF